MSHLTNASITINGVSLPVVDCQHWAVGGNFPVCRQDLDVAGCAECPSRLSRNGDFANPPLLDGGVSQKAAERPARRSNPSPSPAPSEPAKGGWRGLGDVVASVTSAVGIKPCGGCGKRREALNRLVPFKQPDPPPQELLGDPNE